MESEMFWFLLYIGAMQVAMLILTIVMYMKRGPSYNTVYGKPNPESVKVMVHYENGEAHLKDGVIVEGNLWNALEGKENAYLRANGGKYKIIPKSCFKDNILHVMDKNKVEAPTMPKPEPQSQKQEPPTQSNIKNNKLSPKEVSELYDKWKDLPPEEVQKRFNLYLKERGMEVKNT